MNLHPLDPLVQSAGDLPLGLSKEIETRRSLGPLTLEGLKEEGFGLVRKGGFEPPRHEATRS